jgi:hypothetical protein
LIVTFARAVVNRQQVPANRIAVQTTANRYVAPVVAAIQELIEKLCKTWSDAKVAPVSWWASLARQIKRSIGGLLKPLNLVCPRPSVCFSPIEVHDHVLRAKDWPRTPSALILRAVVRDDFVMSDSGARLRQPSPPGDH